MRRLNALVTDQEFVPARSRERFRVAMTDHGSTILLPNVLERLRRDAPDSELVVSAVGPQTYDEVAAGRIDLILCAEEVPPELENEVVFNLDFVCLVGARQRIKSRRVTLKQYLRLPHAMVLTGDGHQAMVDQPLKALGQKRHVALRIPFYIPAVLAIAQTDLVLTVPRTLANVTKQISTLRTIEPPICATIGDTNFGTPFTCMARGYLGSVHEREKIVRQAQNSVGRVTTERQNAPQMRREKREFRFNHPQKKSAVMEFYDVTLAQSVPRK
jgi:hypothetical protein